MKSKYHKARTTLLPLTKIEFTLNIEVSKVQKVVGKPPDLNPIFVSPKLESDKFVFAQSRDQFHLNYMTRGPMEIRYRFFFGGVEM